MHKGRLEAFSDGVLAIILTIMVLEIKVPRGADFAALRPLLPVVLSYVLSFIYIGIYWNNHHMTLARAIGRDFKSRSSPPLYVAGIAASFWQPWMAGGIDAAVALMWLIPDRRIERTLAGKA